MIAARHRTRTNCHRIASEITTGLANRKPVAAASALKTRDIPSDEGEASQVHDAAQTHRMVPIHNIESERVGTEEGRARGLNVVSCSCRRRALAKIHVRDIQRRSDPTVLRRCMRAQRGTRSRETTKNSPRTIRGERREGRAGCGASATGCPSSRKSPLSTGTRDGSLLALLLIPSPTVQEGKRRAPGIRKRCGIRPARLGPTAGDPTHCGVHTL
ncbi:hypothetical protein MRX96_024245 [Rhipicephalus microplus]